METATGIAILIAYAFFVVFLILVSPAADNRWRQWIAERRQARHPIGPPHLENHK